MKFSRQDYQDAADGKIPWQIPEDEPVFLLRGQDKVAAETVVRWGIAALKAGASEETVTSAFNQAFAMARWAQKQIPSIPGEKS